MSDRAIVETVEIDTGRLKPAAPDAAPGRVSKLDRYELRKPLGRGGFATVYEAYDPRIKRSVAIKQCSSLDQENHERFFREAEIAGNLSHPNIVRIFDFGLADGVPFIVQELLGGKDLADWIESGLELSTYERVRILVQIANALAYAHSQGVIHRDIKPANIRVLDDGSIKLLDFGVAAIQEAPSDLTQAGTTVGTVAYLAPEQIRGERPNHATDVFSFGVLGYELLSGHRPFEGETLSAVLYQIAHRQPETLRPGAIPGRLIRIVHQCLEKQAERRPASLEDVSAELEEVLRDPRLRPPSAETAPIATYPTGAPSKATLGLRPNQALTIADVPLEGLGQPLRDSSTRIQVARPRRRAGRVVLSLIVLLVAPLMYSLLGGPLPERASNAITEAESRIPEPLQAWLGLFREPPLPAPVGTASTQSRVPATVTPDSPPAAVSPQPDQDPVTAAIAVLKAQKRPIPAAPAASKPKAQPARRVASTASATVILPPGWHPRMMVSVDGGTFQSLDRRKTRKLVPGKHRLTFRLDTRSYQALETVDLRLEPAETRTIESPLQPPAALGFGVVPSTVGGRFEIDGRSVEFPLTASQVVEPGSHRLTFYPSPADPLGPLTKTVNLRSATTHLVTFDMRRRRALLESLEAFEWDGS